MTCPWCGKETAPGARFCTGCGRELVQEGSMDELRREMDRVARDLESAQAGLRRLREGLGLPGKGVEPVSRAQAFMPGPSTYIPPPVSEPPRETPAKPRPRPIPRRGPLFPSAAFSEARLGQKWLLILGVILMVVGIGFFLKYSFSQNWVGPAGRVAMSYLAGMGGLALGELFRRKGMRSFGLTLGGGGIAILYFASWAAFQVYGLFGQGASFGLMALVTALAGVLALTYDALPLAVLGITGGFLTPVVLSTGMDNQPALMTYMALLNGGILWTAFHRRWGLLQALGMAFTWLLFSAWFGTNYQDGKFWATTFFLNLFFLVYAFAPFAYYLRTGRREPLRGFFFTIPNAFIAFGYSFVTIRDFASLPWVGLASVAYAAVFAFLAAALFRRNRETVEAFVLLLAQAVLFLVVTVPVLFSAEWITLFWAVQAVTLLWAAVRLGNRWLYLGSAALLLLAGGKLVVWDWQEVFPVGWEGGYLDGFAAGWAGRWASTLAVLGAFHLGGRLVRPAGDGLRIFPGLPREYRGFFILFGALLFAVLNREVSAAFAEFAPPARFAALSVLWALFAGGLMVLGFRINSPWVRRTALALFGLTAAKVLLVDMSRVGTPWRIVSFLVLGALLIAASWLYHMFRDRLLPGEGKGGAP